MTDLQLYTLVVPADSQSGLPSRLQQQLATAGILNQDGGVVEQLSSGPGDQTVSGHYRAQYADKMARELEELSQASGFGTVPLAGIGGPTPIDGYYAVESADVEQVAPQTPLVQRYSVTLRHKGTQNDYYRALKTAPYDGIDNPFGSDNRALVGVPAAATKVQWLDPDTKDRAIASQTAARSAELGSVDVYDLADAPFAEPWLVYEVGYTSEEDVDCRVWDGRGASTKFDVDGNVEWGKVFSTSHDFASKAVLDNGLLRFEADEAAGTIAAKRWSSGSWSRVSLTQPSSTTLYDVDFVEVAMATIRAQLTFDVNGSLATVDAALHRGHEDVQFTVPPSESSIPQDVIDWLTPIASPLTVDPSASKDLVARSDLRR